jgi:hypothetical protein
MNEQAELQPVSVETPEPAEPVTIAAAPPSDTTAVEAPEPTEAVTIAESPPKEAPATVPEVPAAEPRPTCPRCERADKVLLPSEDLGRPGRPGRVTAPFCSRCVGFLTAVGTRQEWENVLATCERMRRGDLQVV